MDQIDWVFSGFYVFLCIWALSSLIWILRWNSKTHQLIDKHFDALDQRCISSLNTLNEGFDRMDELLDKQIERIDKL